MTLAHVRLVTVCVVQHSKTALATHLSQYPQHWFTIIHRDAVINSGLINGTCKYYKKIINKLRHPTYEKNTIDIREQHNYWL